MKKKLLDTSKIAALLAAIAIPATPTFAAQEPDVKGRSGVEVGAADPAVGTPAAQEENEIEVDGRAGVKVAPATATNTKTIAAIAGNDVSLTTLGKALKATGLDETLGGEGPYTLFAPTDQAFAALPEGALESLLEPANKETLTAILLYHVLAGKVTSDGITEEMTAETVGGGTLDVKPGETTVTVNGARVLKADIMASNGVIHAINKVLMPTMEEPAQ